MRTSLRFLPGLLTAGVLAFLACGCSPRAKIARHLERANRYFDSGQYDKAEVEYINALRVDSLNPQAISRLGSIYYEQGRIGRAYPLFDIAQMILQKPERHLVIINVEKKPDGQVIQPLFLCALDETLWLSEEEAIHYVLEKHFTTFYQPERTQI